MKKITKKVMAIVMAISFSSTQFISVMASDKINNVSDEELSAVLDGMNSVVTQLHDFGMSYDDIETFMKLVPKGEGFYSKPLTQYTYDGDFKIANVDAKEIPASYGLVNYDGNPPKSMLEQRERTEHVLKVAQKNFYTFRYEGAKKIENFGDYTTYLYLSHYIDGPLRAPTANDLPEVISNDDITAYKRFLSGSNMSKLTAQFANFATKLYSVPNVTETILNPLSTLDKNTMENVDTVYTICSTVTGGAESGSDIAKQVMPLIMNNFVEEYNSANTEEELVTAVQNNISGQLTSLDFYNKYSEEITDTIISAFIGSVISLTAGTLTMVGLYVSMVPIFAYEFAGLFQELNVLVLANSFQGRYIRRAEIEYGF